MPRKSVRILTSFAVAAIVALAVPAAPGLSVAHAQAQPQARPLVKVRITKIPIANYVPVDVALARGWFREEGLDVNIEGIMTGTLAMGALVSNRLDIIYETFLVGLKAKAAGFDVLAISNCCNAALKNPDGSAILVRRDAMRGLKELEGKRLAVQTLQNINWAYARESLVRAGGNPAKVTFIEIPFPLMVDALLGSQTDAIYTVEPFTTIGVGTGKMSVLSFPHSEVQPGLNIAGYIARGAWVRENPGAAAAFRRAVQRAVDFMEQNPQEKSAAILKYTTLKPELLAKMTLDKWTTVIDAADLQRQLDLYVRHGMIDKTFDVKTIIAP